MIEVNSVLSNTLKLVFSDVMGIKVGQVDIVNGIAPHEDCVSMLNFDGEYIGRLALAVAPNERQRAAKRFAQCMGMDCIDGIPSELVLVETENIVAGHLLTRLNDRGVSLRMSPSVLNIDKTPVANAHTVVIKMRIVEQQEFDIAFGFEIVLD